MFSATIRHVVHDEPYTAIPAGENRHSISHERGRLTSRFWGAFSVCKIDPAEPTGNCISRHLGCVPRDTLDSIPSVESRKKDYSLLLENPLLIPKVCVSEIISCLVTLINSSGIMQTDYVHDFGHFSHYIIEDVSNIIYIIQPTEKLLVLIIWQDFYENFEGTL